jgi:LacI family gluconate utilization system Gnt-I transcriptional repressor
MTKHLTGKREEAQQPTMTDVARHAGVSTMTVSRALKDGGVVSKATRERILAAIEELGYVLDLSAGGLSSKRTGFVAAIIPSINNSNFSDTARGITDALEGSGLHLLLGYTDYSVQQEEKLIEAMLRRRPEGIILTGGSHTARARKMLVNAAIPVVETWDVQCRGDGAAGPPACRKGLQALRLYRRHDGARYARQSASRRLPARPGRAGAAI